MAKFATNYTFRNPLRTIEFRAGQETVDAEVIAEAEKAGALQVEIIKETPDASNGPAKGGKTGRPINLKG